MTARFPQPPTPLGWGYKVNHRYSLLVFCLLAQIPLTSAATDYYYSTSGSDTNSGTSPDAPWYSFYEMYLKSVGIGGRTRFQPGDRVLLKAGDVFDQQISFFSSGTSNSPIVLGRYGDGANPVLEGDCNSSLTWTLVVGHSNLYSAQPSVLANQIMEVADTNGLMYTKLAQNAGESLADWLGRFATTNWGYSASNTVAIYVFASNAPVQKQFRAFFKAINVTADYVRVENLDIRRCYYGIFYSSGRGSQVYSNSVQDSLGVGIYFYKCAGGEMVGNTVARGGWTLLYFDYGGGHVARYNTVSYATNNILGIDSPFRGGVELCGIGLKQGTNNLVEHNTWLYMKDSFFDTYYENGSTIRYNYCMDGGAACSPHGTGFRVHHNIFSMGGRGTGIGGFHAYSESYSDGADQGANLIYNNVVYDFTSYGFYFGTNYSGVVCRNNLFIGTTDGVNVVNVHAGVDMDYNLFYTTTGTPDWFWNNTKHTSLAAFQAASGQETNGLFADPQFVSANPTSPQHYKLQATSPALNAGQNLKTAGFLSADAAYVDYNGVPILGNTPSIGAFNASSRATATTFRANNVYLQ